MVDHRKEEGVSLGILDRDLCQGRVIKINVTLKIIPLGQEGES